MARTNDASTAAPATAEATESSVAANGELANGDGDAANSQQNVFSITVKLPHEPKETKIMVSTQEQVQDIRQSIVDFPYSFQYSCFHLEHDGERINDFVELSEVPGVGPDSGLTLVEDPYTEKEARLHVVRVRELVGAAGDRTDTLHGIQAGLSLYDTVLSAGSSQNGTSNGTSQPPMGAYDFDAPATVKTLVAPYSASPKTVKSISLSPWNPPPYNYRMKGHLLYLFVVTSEGQQYHVTSHVSGFYANKCSAEKFDPSPRQPQKDFFAHSLLVLLEKLSPSFKNSFNSLLEYNNGKDPLSLVQLPNAIPASPWLVPPPASAATSHQPDITRSQESYLLSGIESPDTLRDWNEELQSTRELPREAVQDRVFRERLLSKLFADYNDAATRGAVLVARGELSPLNPTESRDAQIYVWNNVFFSFGADGVGTFATEGGDEAARVATGKDVMGVKAVNQLDIAGLFTPGTVVVDYLGKRIVGQSIVPGIFKQREPGEHQIDYGGVEGKDVVADNEVFVPLFEQLSKAMRVKKHAVWDREGQRHDLEGSVETKGLLGTDARKYVLDLYRVSPLDISWLEQYWSEPDESGKKQDLEKNYPHRMAVLRPELVESYGRLKLRDYIRAELAKRSETAKDNKSEETDGEKKPETETSVEAKDDSTAEADVSGETEKAVTATKEEGEAEKTEDDTDKKDDQDRVDISGFQFSLNPDVYCGQLPQTDEEKQEYEKDEAEVRAACEYLLSDIIPRLIHDLQEGDVGFPIDGQALSALLHKRGINIRYLGTVANLADKLQPRLQALRRLAIQEMIIRGFKHVANRMLRYLPTPFTGACVAYLLNCFLGSDVNPKPVADIDEALKAIYADSDFSFADLSPESLKKEIVDQINMRYRYQLDDDWIQPGKQLQMLREVCLRLGLQLEATEYVFTKEQLATASSASSVTSETAPAPAVNGVAKSGGKKKKKGGASQAQARPDSPTKALPKTTFQADDVLNIVPVVKEASPKSALADEALEAGRLSLAQDQKDLGQELLFESLSLHEQIYGVLHPEVAKIYQTLSSLLYSLDEKAAAVELARKAVIVSERTLGIDHADTILSYLNLGLFEHANDNSRAALAYMKHALDLWKIVYGIRHPDSITTINNAAVMLQGLKQFRESREWFEASLAISREVSGEDSVGTATLLFQLAQALALDKDMHTAVNRMRESYTIFRNTLGPEDRNTKEAESLLQMLTQSAVSHAKQAKAMMEQGRFRRIPLASRNALRPQPQAGQTAADTTSVVSARTTGGPDQRKLEDLVKYIEGTDSKQKTPKKRTANPKTRGKRA